MSATPTLAGLKALASVSCEVLTLILAHLSLPDILNVGRTCKRWHHASCDSAVWRRLFLRHFTVDLHHRPPSLLVANAFTSAHGVRSASSQQSRPSFISSIQWKELFRLQYCWASGRCSRKTIFDTDPKAQPRTPVSEHALATTSRSHVTSFLAVDELVLLGKRNGNLVVVPTRPPCSSPIFETRLDPPAPVLGLFCLEGSDHQGSNRTRTTIVSALTPKRIHRFLLDRSAGSLTFLSSAKHMLLSSGQSSPIKLLSLPTIKGSYIDASTLVLLVAPVLSTTNTNSSSSAANQLSSNRHATLAIINPISGVLSHTMAGNATPCPGHAFDLVARLNHDRSRLKVLLCMPTQLYTPPNALEHHELRLQTIHFQRSLPDRWHFADSHVALPWWTPNALWSSPLSQHGIPLSPPTHHSPIASIRIAQDLAVPTTTTCGAASLASLRYVVAAHQDHSLSLYALARSTKEHVVSHGVSCLYFLGTLPDRVHSAILDFTISASTGRVVAVCRDGKARVWQLEPWLPVPGTGLGADPCLSQDSSQAAPAAVDYDILFHRPALSYTRKSQYSILHLSNKTAATTRVPRAPVQEEDRANGHYHQGIAGQWHVVDAVAGEHLSSDASARKRQSAWQEKRVRTDALVTEITIVPERGGGGNKQQGEQAEKPQLDMAWVHVSRDQVVCGLRAQVICLSFAE